MTIASPMVLAETRDLVLPALQAAVDQLDPTSRAQASYHLCWTDADGNPEAGPGGKSLRPALALLSARAAGAPPEVGVPGAVAVELVHNFSLLHDDVMDGDRSRRHRPTVWSLWGVPSAILTGDAMLALAQQVLLSVPGPGGSAAARLLADHTQQLIRGQVDDVYFEGRDGKTGSLMAASAAIGAVLAGAPPRLVAALEGFGHQLGLAFQLVDDLLGIWGDPEVTGKPVMSDLRSRKNSLPICYAVSRGGGAADELRAWLIDPSGDTEQRLRAMADLIEEVGGRAWTEQEAARRVDAGEDLLTLAGVPSDVAGELAAIGRFVVGREH
jgi:geranylgeranyl diphosphate synthase type I